MVVDDYVIMVASAYTSKTSAEFYWQTHWDNWKERKKQQHYEAA